LTAGEAARRGGGRDAVPYFPGPAIIYHRRCVWQSAALPACVVQAGIALPGHNFTFSAVETANAALAAGTDLNCGPFYQMWLAPPGGLAANGSVPAALVAAAAARLYRSHFLLGLLDPPGGKVYPALAPSTVDSQAHRDLARRAASESLVLSKNAGGALPLPGGGAGSELAFIGPHANATQDFLSNYHGTNTLGEEGACVRGCICAVAHPRPWLPPPRCLQSIRTAPWQQQPAEGSASPTPWDATSATLSPQATQTCPVRGGCNVRPQDTAALATHTLVDACLPLTRETRAGSLQPWLPRRQLTLRELDGRRCCTYT